MGTVVSNVRVTCDPSLGSQGERGEHVLLLVPGAYPERGGGGRGRHGQPAAAGPAAYGGGALGRGQLGEAAAGGEAEGCEEEEGGGGHRRLR